MRDMTQLYDAQDKFKRSEHRYPLLLRAMKEGVFTIDFENRITYCNQSFAHMLGYREEQRLSLEITSLLAPEQSFALTLGDFSLPYPILQNMEIIWRGIDDTPVHTVLSPSILYKDNEQPIGLLALITDVTRQRSQERELEKLESNLQQAHKMESLDTSPRDIYDNLNNLLSVILKCGEIAKERSKQDLQLNNYLDKILFAGNRAKDLVQQLLSFSRRNEQQFLHFKPGGIIQETLKMLRQSIPKTSPLPRRLIWMPGRFMRIQHISTR